jgi:hypothetical protein
MNMAAFWVLLTYTLVEVSAVIAAPIITQALLKYLVNSTRLRGTTTKKVVIFL